MTEKVDGILRDVSVKELDMEFEGVSPIVIYSGYVYDDKKGRFRDGTFIHTSYIVSGPDKKGIIKTRNSTYKIESYHTPDLVPYH